MEVYSVFKVNMILNLMLALNFQCCLGDMNTLVNNLDNVLIQFLIIFLE